MYDVIQKARPIPFNADRSGCGGDESIVVGVIQKEDPPVKRQRGRPPGFDEAAVIDGAVDLFLQHGYEGTSLEDIREHLGVRGSTLYNSFGGKAGLYDSAIDRYLSGAEEFVFAPVRDGEAGLEDLISLLRKLTKILTTPGRPGGCLAVNAMITGEHHGAVDRYTGLLRESIDAALTRPVALGEIEPAAAPEIASSCSAMILGMSVAARSGATETELRKMHAGFAHAVRSWRTGQEATAG